MGKGVKREESLAQEVAPAPRAKSMVREYAEALIIAVLLALVIRTFVVQAFKIPSGSMLPTLQIGDHILVNKFLYYFQGIRRGDIIVFKFPQDETRDFIKRVIGMPGDVVRIDQGVVYVNGRRLQESYVPPDYRDRLSMADMKIGQDYYFVLGDHRSSSNDSRNWGPVHRRSVYGKAVFVYWPPEKIGPVR